jgi:hypothetical protein
MLLMMHGQRKEIRHGQVQEFRTSDVVHNNDDSYNGYHRLLVRNGMVTTIYNVYIWYLTPLLFQVTQLIVRNCGEY